MRPPDATRRLYRLQEGYARRTYLELAKLWGRFDPFDLDRSWRIAVPRMSVTLATGMSLAASDADGYLAAVIAEQGGTAAPTARISPQAFGQLTMDGRQLSEALYEPVIAAKVAARSQALVMDAGLKRLEQVVTTQVADAGRQSVATGMTARPEITGYTRMLDGDPCSRCVVLAGVTYRWNDGFKRHPMCQCVHIPKIENVPGDPTTDPAAYFRSLSEADQDRVFGQAGAQALREGADIGQVVNARSGMYTTADGRSVTRQGRRGDGRLMPEQIYADAADRDEAVDLLREYGYLR